MRPRLGFPVRPLRASLTRRLLVPAAALTMSASALLVATPASAPAATTNPVTPGNFTGRGFDQCLAPTQRAMDVWLTKSPYRAVGIYISGNSRACRSQPNLTPTWVSTQLRKGWRLLPITLGPQASCSSRYPKYGASIDPTINPSPTNTYAAARSQGTTEANRAVAAAKNLGISPGSTLFYDLEGFDLNASTHCNNSALRFMSAWTSRLHTLGYASGVYSSAGSGIVLLDRARTSKPAGYVDPDQLWIARWDGKANTSTTYIPDAGWKNQRIKQYRGGHNETYGGVTINIDSNYLDVRMPRLPGGAATPPTPTPTNTMPPPARGMADPKCTTASINRSAYRATNRLAPAASIVALQCLLKQQRHYPYMVTGSWNVPTATGLKAFQRKVGQPQRTYVNRANWVAMLTYGASNSTLRLGSSGADVIRVQRAMNAARDTSIAITGRYDAATRGAVTAYQRKVGVKPTGVVGALTWSALHRGRN